MWQFQNGQVCLWPHMFDFYLLKPPLKHLPFWKIPHFECFRRSCCVAVSSLLDLIHVGLQYVLVLQSDILGLVPFGKTLSYSLLVVECTQPTRPVINAPVDTSNCPVFLRWWQGWDDDFYWCLESLQPGKWWVCVLSQNPRSHTPVVGTILLLGLFSVWALMAWDWRRCLCWQSEDVGWFKTDIWILHWCEYS